MDPADLVRDASLIAEELVQHLAKEPGVRVQVVIEVQAEAPDGFSSDLQRVLRENSPHISGEFSVE